PPAGAHRGGAGSGTSARRNAFSPGGSIATPAARRPSGSFPVPRGGSWNAEGLMAEEHRDTASERPDEAGSATCGCIAGDDGRTAHGVDAAIKDRNIKRLR